MNNLVTALIIDDEPLARAEIRRLLQQHPEIEVVGEAADADEARSAIAQLRPSLIFLDIQMPEESGFDLLASLDRGLPDVVFTTAFDKHALRAFEFGAIDYLLKPVAPDRLASAIARVRRSNGDSCAEAPDGGMETVGEHAFRATEKIFVKHGDRCWFVALDQIHGMEADANGVKLWLTDDEPCISRSLIEIERRLPPELFFRANRSQIINLSWVSSITPWFSNCLKITLNGGRTVELSRRQTRLFRERSGI